MFGDARAVIGESPVWSAAESALHRADIRARKLHRTDHVTGSTRSWTVPADLGGCELLPDGSDTIVPLCTGVFRLDLPHGALDPLADAPFDPRMHRFHESGIDPAGRLWLGEMSDPLPGAEAEPTNGPLYAIMLLKGLVAHEAEAHSANGSARSADGGTFVMAHSDAGWDAGWADAIDFAPEAGKLGRRRVFARIDPKMAIPDGATFDGEGFY